ncbi:hypothetical protein PR202_ga28347 [Eleusine coracana subsp. coracana]|uniref:Uncharacterized protein n=1 Tax=Eleusine coracana subsp. coracana TaxID=191504 RepID=A0AAV5DJ01_ELECO|nr:hypothetical protein PR202_ga28347 [Eleusine coracana subsp. coracana]
MEALYLLASLATTLLTSAVHSLLLLLHLLVPSFLRRADPDRGVAAAARLYEGRVRHSRRRPAAHAFVYPMRYALVDLDRLPLPDHLSASDARRIACTSGPVHLLTIPKSVGYEQNPLSIYYCYDSAVQEQEGELKMCIAEVTNTPWGERVMFTFQPGSDLVAKPLHVSPFMALRLWLKNVKFLDHPRFVNLSYRDEALKRDLDIRSSCSFLQKQKVDSQRSSVTEVTTDNSYKRENGDKNIMKRWCVWRDAQWPWS